MSSFKDKFKENLSDGRNIVDSAIDALSNKTSSAVSGNVTNTAVPNKTKLSQNITAMGSLNTFDNMAKVVKESHGIPTTTDLSASLESEYINRHDVTLVDNTAAYYRCYVFIGKPDLYLFKDRNGSTMTDAVSENAEMSELIKYEPKLYAQLCRDVSGTTPFMTALSNRCVGISIQDASMSKEESSANNKGIKQVYATTYLESMVNVPTSLTFRMDRKSEVLKLTNMWVKYMEGVKEGTIFQSPEDDALNRMSYTCPIWIFACEENGVDISFYAKLTGNFPLSIPFSVFSYAPFKRDTNEVTINFHTALFKPFDPISLLEFNKLAKTSSTTVPQYTDVSDRDLSYYWVSGAYVTRNETTNKLQLNFTK